MGSDCSRLAPTRKTVVKSSTPQQQADPLIRENLPGAGTGQGGRRSLRSTESAKGGALSSMAAVVVRGGTACMRVGGGRRTQGVWRLRVEGAEPLDRSLAAPPPPPLRRQIADSGDVGGPGGGGVCRRRCRRRCGLRLRRRCVFRGCRGGAEREAARMCCGKGALGLCACV